MIETTGIVGLVLRIEDGGSRDYASRVNIERELPAGPFRIAIPVRGTRTSSGRPIDAGDIRRIVLGRYAGTGVVRVSRFEIVQAQMLPAGIAAYALGPLDSPLPGGFERIGPADPRVAGSNVRGVRLPGPDPLIAAGLSGIERLWLPAPPGLTRVTMFTENPGEWDFLPPVLDQRITVNGRLAHVVALAPAQWIAQRYLRGADAEHSASEDAWTAFGRWRGNPVAVDVDVGADGVTIEIGGGSARARYLAGAIVEPAGGALGLDLVQQRRAAWYRSTYPVSPASPDTSPRRIALALDWAGEPAATLPAVSVVVAPGSGARVALAVTSTQPIVRPQVEVVAPRQGADRVGAQLWVGQQRLELGRTLQLDDRRLLASVGGLPLAGERARRWEVWLTAAAGAPPGTYEGSLTITYDGRRRIVPLHVEVLDVALPPAPKPAGFYLAHPPHLAWFDDTRPAMALQAACDLAVMAGFGLAGSAPAFPTVTTSAREPFVASGLAALRGGVAPGWLVYDGMPAGPVASRVELIGLLAEDLARAGLPPPVWSVADEPSNPDIDATALAGFVRALRARRPGIDLGAQLNNPSDASLLPLFDTAIINSGYGLDVATIAQAAAGGRKVWIYNTASAIRHTAGMWLWRTAAERYVQWHARMPTADPFDPLDGREGDFQMIYPSAEICPPQPDIDRALLQMAEGVVDQRWLAWLDSRDEVAARRLSTELRAHVGTSWERLSKRPDEDLQRMREQIIAYFRSGRSGTRAR